MIEPVIAVDQMRVISRNGRACVHAELERRGQAGQPQRTELLECRNETDSDHHRAEPYNRSRCLCGPLHVHQNFVYMNGAVPVAAMY